MIAILEHIIAFFTTDEEIVVENNNAASTYLPDKYLMPLFLYALTVQYLFAVKKPYYLTVTVFMMNYRRFNLVGRRL
ncbi:MAG: hypothetical protein ACLQQ4_08955 [Bacteroidia bacterium]